MKSGELAFEFLNPFSAHQFDTDDKRPQAERKGTLPTHTHSCNAEMKKMEEDTAGYEKKKKKEKVHTWMSPAENCERILRMWRE